MAGAFNLDEMLGALNENLQGTPVTELPGFETMSFLDDNGDEFELGRGMSRGQQVIKVRYRKNLTPLNQNTNGYYISVYDGNDANGQPKFRTITGALMPTSANFVRWQPARAPKQRKPKEAVMAPARTSRAVAKPRASSSVVDVTMMSEEDLNNIDSPATRRELARRQRVMRAEAGEQASALADEFQQQSCAQQFGRRQTKKSALAKVNAEIKYLKSI